MLIPEQLRYTKDHLWIDTSRTVTRIGITDYAQELLGTISFIELPEAGAAIDSQGKLATLEGLKSVIDLFAPFACKIISANSSLAKNPKLINSSPYDDGWIAEVEASNRSDLESLLTKDGYTAIIDQ
jgi:glycine cleavage system H protein